jgi:hypothetical protein
MMTKYGELPNEMLVDYVDKMMGKVHKIYPLKENNVQTLNKYIESLLREFVNCEEVVFYFRDNQDFLQLISILESFLNQEDMSAYRSDWLKAKNIIERMQSKLGDES